MSKEIEFEIVTEPTAEELELYSVKVGELEYYAANAVRSLSLEDMTFCIQSKTNWKTQYLQEYEKLPSIVRKVISNFCKEHNSDPEEYWCDLCAAAVKERHLGRGSFGGQLS